MNSDAKKILYLIGAVILLVVASILLLLYRNSGVQDTVGDKTGQTVHFPDSPNISYPVSSTNPPREEVTLPNQIAQNQTSDNTFAELAPSVTGKWREELVVYETVNDSDDKILPNTNQYENSKIYAKDNYTIDGLDLNYQPPGESTYVPELFDITPYLYVPTTTSFASQDRLDSLPKLENNQFDSCGSVSIPASVLISEDVIKNYINTLAKKSAVKCLADAVIADCQSKKLSVSALSYSTIVYLTNRNDGVCGYGVVSGSVDKVYLCSVVDDLNISTGKNLTFSEWQSEFRQNKTDTIKVLLNNSINPAISNRVNTYQPRDCIIYEL